MNAHELFDPARLPERDGYGWTVHPDIDPLFQAVIEREGCEEVGPTDAETIDWLCDRGLDAWWDYDCQGMGSAWIPETPAREGGHFWRLAFILEACDGNYALFVRPKVTT